MSLTQKGLVPGMQGLEIGANTLLEVGIPGKLILIGTISIVLNFDYKSMYLSKYLMVVSLDTYTFENHQKPF